MDEFKNHGELLFAYYKDPKSDQLKLHLAAKVKSLPPTEELLFYHPNVDARDTQTTNLLTRAHARSAEIVQKVEAQSQHGAKSFVQGGVVLARLEDPAWYYLGVISDIEEAKDVQNFHVNFLHDDSSKRVSRDEVRPMILGKPCKLSGELLLPYFPSKADGIRKHFEGEVKWPKTPDETKKEWRVEAARRRSQIAAEQDRMAQLPLGVRLSDNLAESKKRRRGEDVPRRS